MIKGMRTNAPGPEPGGVSMRPALWRGRAPDQAACSAGTRSCQWFSEVSSSAAQR